MTEYTVGGEAIDTSVPEAPEPTVMVRQVVTVVLADGTELTAALGNPDSIRWEQTAARRWPELLPQADDHGNLQFKAPMFMQTFMAWAALKRTRQYDGTFEEFSERDAMDVRVSEEPIRPTQPGQSPG